MNQGDQQRFLKMADALCRHQKARLTAKRKRILTILLQAGTPLSAYQISDRYREAHEQQMSIMSVYRMLNFLIDQHLAHRLETTNQYLPCAHIDAGHTSDTAHGTPQFLICDKCKRVDESGLRTDILEQLDNELRKTGFTMDQQQLEIHGTCQRCAKRA
ncbi:MAG: Fur family transcriptional regulator [Pseudohongiella sp.]|uniref:Fur family transcriptional regulator n=1 Tax=Pseudohongiella sp. TaxID=1979412 RepID=UPI00349FE56C